MIYIARRIYLSWEAGRYTKPRNLVLVLVVSVTLEMFYPLQMHSNTWKNGNPFESRES